MLHNVFVYAPKLFAVDDGTEGRVPEARYQLTKFGILGLPLPVAWLGYRPLRPGAEHRHHLYPTGIRLSVPDGGD